MKNICIVPYVSGAGGMASFRMKFEAGLHKRGIAVTHDPIVESDAILVIGGTRRLLPLWRAKQRGIRIVQRLDGINWVQRVRWSGIRYSVRAEYGNALMAFIRNRIADRVIYQSKFISGWWEEWYGRAPVREHIILNGADLKTFSPIGSGTTPDFPPYRIVVVEGSLSGGLDTGLQVAVRLWELLCKEAEVILTIAGKVDARTKRRLEDQRRDSVHVLGVIPRGAIPELMRSSHVLFSAEVNPPCPNSVIEALACGTPVVGYDTGSLHELIGSEAGLVVPYGGDPWKLEPPDVLGLAQATEMIFNNQKTFRKAARLQAVNALDVDSMVDEYLKVLLED